MKEQVIIKDNQWRLPRRLLELEYIAIESLQVLRGNGGIVTTNIGSCTCRLAPHAGRQTSSSSPCKQQQSLSWRVVHHVLRVVGGGDTGNCIAGEHRGTRKISIEPSCIANRATRPDSPAKSSTIEEHRRDLRGRVARCREEDDLPLKQQKRFFVDGSMGGVK
jgi:hypothetical protein